MINADWTGFSETGWVVAMGLLEEVWEEGSTAEQGEVGQGATRSKPLSLGAGGLKNMVMNLVGCGGAQLPSGFVCLSQSARQAAASLRS